MVDGVETLQYADDLVIYCKDRCLDDCVEKVNRALRKIEIWMVEHDMEGSVAKTNAVIFSKGKRYPRTSVRYRNEVVDYVETYKYLGVIFDSHMTWTPFIEHLCKKASKSLNVMRSLTRVWWGSDPKIMLNIYKGLVRSHLDFGCQAIYKTSKANWRKLDRFQFQALRMVLGCMRSTPTNVLLSETGEWPIEIRRFWICTKFTLKHLALNNSLIAKKLLNFYQLYNEEPRYWRNVKCPPILEGIDLALQYVDRIYQPNNLFCFSVEYKCQLIKINCWDSKIMKGDRFSHQICTDIIKNKFRNYMVVYTDASVDLGSGRCGIGFYCPDLQAEEYFKLTDGTNICTAEIIAIRKAVQFCKNFTKNLLII